jgi:hypothetical protein
MDVCLRVQVERCTYKGTAYEVPRMIKTATDLHRSGLCAYTYTAYMLTDDCGDVGPSARLKGMRS